MKVSRKLLLVEFVIIASVAGAVSYFLIVPPVNYHFQRLSLNLYDNGVTDFSTDITGLVRGLGTMALLTMVLGLLIGTTIGLGPVQGLVEKESMEGQIVRSIKVDVTLLKSRLVSAIATEEGTKFELTDEGKRFLAEYEKNQASEKSRV